MTPRQRRLQAERRRAFASVAGATALLLIAAMALATPARGEPPSGVNTSGPVAKWFRSLKALNGFPCCDEADCRRTFVRMVDGGGWEAWVGKKQFGEDAPDEWVRIPDEEVRTRGNRPPGIVGAIACYYAGRLVCADLDAGM